MAELITFPTVDRLAQEFHALTGDEKALTRLADAGKTIHQIAAVSGHKTLKEVERYTRTADQRRLAREAMGIKEGASADQAKMARNAMAKTASRK